MTRLSPEAKALVARAGEVWLKRKSFKLSVEARVRAQVEERMAVEERRLDLELAHALQAALDAGSTKSALKLVTSKNPGTIERFLALLGTSVAVAEESQR